uniref:Beta-catenin-like protein 1 N-terminal domain-containing protein n=1 Tax=Glossina austeni TaxID=7395 RepID=A0A1A9V2S8_GLOAU
MSTRENQASYQAEEPATAPKSEKGVLNGSDRNEELFASNPNVLEVEKADPEDLQRIRGDAIGDTLYSERFVLNILLKLSKLEKNLQEEEEMEKDLCTLWDMTLDADMIEYLLKQDVLTLFAEVIKATNDKRLTEILVGILANMCDLKKTRDDLCLQESQLVEVLLDLSGCLDALTLQQLMRLWAVIFVKSPTEHIEKWYDLVCKDGQFIENICFILNNAINHKVLLQTLETLNAVLAKFALLDNPAKNFTELFIKSEVINATMEAFNTILTDNAGQENDTDELEKKEVKIKQTFCNIHSILTQYQQYSEEAYAAHSEDILLCMKKILKPLALEVDLETWQTFELEVFETLSDLLEILPRCFDPHLSSYLIKIWLKVLQTQQSSASTEFEEELNHQDLSDKCLQLLLLILTQASNAELQENLKTVQSENKGRFLKSVEKLEKNGCVVKAYDKIKNALGE